MSEKSRKIIGVTVGTPTPRANLKQTDPRKADYVKGKDIIPEKVSQLENDAGYLTKHQDISGKLDASKLPEAIDNALAQAKASGAFDGENGGYYTPTVTQPNANTMRVTFSTSKSDMPSVAAKDVALPSGSPGAPGAPGADGGYYTPTVTQPNASTMRVAFSPSKSDMPSVSARDIALPAGENGITPHIGSNSNWYIGNTDTGIKAQGEDVVGITNIAKRTVAGVEVLYVTLSDGSEKSFTLPSGAKGDPGTSVTITKISESTDSGGSNLVAFSDGKTLTIKNGKDGKDGQDGVTPTKGIDYFDGKDGEPGKDGSDYVLTESDKQEIAEMAAELVDIPGGEVTEEEHTAEFSNTGFTRPNGSTSPASSGRYTNRISTDGVTKIRGNVGFYSACSTIAFYSADGTALESLNVLGTEFITTGYNYGDGTFELDITDEKYADAAYFVVSSYRNKDQSGYYTQPMDFSEDYCKYTKAGAAEDVPRYRIGKDTIAFFGDSITEGGYPELIGSITGAAVTNHAVGGATLASGTDASTHVVEKVNAYTGNDDIICISGGLNDYYKEVPLGTLTAGYSDALDTTTVMGALEAMFRKLFTDHPTAKLYFVITHKAAGTEINPNEDGLTFEDYHDAIVRVLDKYSIPFYDAYSDSGLISNTNAPWGETISNLYTTNSDATHPNEAGYLKYYVYQIIGMMENGIGSSKQVSRSALVNDVIAALPVYYGEVEDA